MLIDIARSFLVVDPAVPIADPATERRKPCLCQGCAASASARRPFRYRDSLTMPMSGRCVLADFRWCPTKLAVISLSNHVPYEFPALGVGVLRWLPWHWTTVLD
jgi:hypothetical protein